MTSPKLTAVSVSAPSNSTHFQPTELIPNIPRSLGLAKSSDKTADETRKVHTCTGSNSSASGGARVLTSGGIGCKSLNTSSTSLSAASSTIVRSSKRSSSSSNDLLYERDRFRARLQTFNTSNKSFNNDVINGQPIETELCEVCDSIGFKTTKLNIFTEKENENISPLDANSSFYTNLPAMEEFPHEMVVKLINHDQLKALFDWYFNKPLPETKVMFPWLHGLSKDNYAQKQFFIFQTQQKCLDINVGLKPENVRFLMCINSTNEKPILKNTVNINEVLQPIDTSRVVVKKIVTDIVNKVFDGVSDGLVDLFVKDCITINYLPIFLNLDPDRGVSLRNFHIQVAKLATCSDFLIYGNNYLSIARTLWLAQRYESVKDKTDLKYNIFVVGDLNSDDKAMFTSKVDEALFENKKNQLISKLFNSNHLSIWDNDYQIKEKIETTKMSSATKLNKNVWVGNLWDYQSMLNHLENSNLKIYKSDDRHLYCDPANSIITRDKDSSSDIINYLSSPKANWRLLIYCHNDASFPDLSTLSSLLFKYTISSHKSIDNEYHVLEFPPSGSIGLGDCKKENLMSIVNTCKLIYLFSSSMSNEYDVLGSLIYCSDGYTESSLLVLCYIMYSNNISLDEAMLELHLTYGRPFYIFNTDVSILRKLEVLLKKLSPLSLGKSIIWSELENLTDAEINELLLSPNLTMIANQPIAHNLRLGYIISDSDSESSSSDSDSETEYQYNVDWVKEVEGSLPSRILPYLYLGSLKHANNLTLLSKLGIRKVISVGEQLDWLGSTKFQMNNDILTNELDGGNIEIFNITPNNESRVNKCSVDTVMKVNNLQDDGIDELAMSLPSILRYIDNEYKKSNGETKILIHCRVGVSRSATVVIAEVMRRLNISLAKAYLYVRVRRLNIIIQPNLRFMYELFKWEEQEKLRNKKDGQVLREIDWFIMCREIMRLNVPYLTN